jgi:DNA-binding response OmpR family regulator
VPSTVPKTTILVVEDDSYLRNAYATALRARGYAVVAVEDGLTALRVVERSTPDAVVLDLALPRLDGRDVYRELAAQPATAGIPVIVVTGSGLTDDDQKRFTCVLQKPVHVHVLIGRIEDCLRKAGNRPA